MVLPGDLSAAVEPQDDDGNDRDDDLGLDLLARARLLCQAANEIALPMLQTVQQLRTKSSPPKDKRKAKALRPSTREEDDRSNQHPVGNAEKAKSMGRVKSRENSSKAPKQPSATLPPIAAPSLPPLPETKKQKPIGKATTNNNKKKEIEEKEATMPLPQIHVTDEWRKKREAEKIRQAQERAKARVLRKVAPVEPLPPRLSNQHGEEASERPESSEMAKLDIQGQIEANRRRAFERVKLRKLELADQETRAAAAKQDAINHQSHSDEAAKKAELFRHRTLQRLQAAKREAQTLEFHESAGETKTRVVDLGEDSDEKDKQRKRLEKQRRRETAERMKRQQQVAEEQHRKDQEMFEKGLSDFKNRKKEQDRVAKGLPPPRPIGDPVVVFEPVAMEPSSTELASTTNQRSPCSDSGERPVEANAVVTTGENEAGEHDSAEALTPVIADSDGGLRADMRPPSSEAVTTRPRPKKVPSWKQPPVPILPAEQYTHKAILSPSDSYAERFQNRSGRASPVPVPDTTLSPLQIPKQRHGRTLTAAKESSQGPKHPSLPVHQTSQ